MPTARVTWVDPTTRDVSPAVPLTAAEIAFIRVKMSANQGQTFIEVGQVNPGVQKFDQVLTTPGTYLFECTTVDKQTPPRESKISAVVPITVPVPVLPPPMEPSNVLVVLLP